MTNFKIVLVLLCLLFQPLLAEEKSVLFTVDMSKLSISARTSLKFGDRALKLC